MAEEPEDRLKRGEGGEIDEELEKAAIDCP